MSDLTRTRPTPLPQSGFDRCIASAVESHAGALRSLLASPTLDDVEREALTEIIEALDDAAIGATLRTVHAARQAPAQRVLSGGSITVQGPDGAKVRLTSDVLYAALREDTKTASDVSALLRLAAERFRSITDDQADALADREQEDDAEELRDTAEEIARAWDDQADEIEDGFTPATDPDASDAGRLITDR